MAYLHNNKDQFQDAIELAYEQTGIMAQAIEKDYYVTMLLRLLSEKMPYIVFKGGTSLSKCHKVIKRFSEDIDITIDTQISQGKKKKIKQAIVSSADELGMNIENLDETRSRRNYNRYKILHSFTQKSHLVISHFHFDFNVRKKRKVRNILIINNLYINIYFFCYQFIEK